MKNVYIVGPTFGLEGVFPRYGYTPWTDRDVKSCPSVDIICFTGGADISPELYGQKQHKTTYCNPSRDEKEVKTYHKYKHLPKLGICRGAQLLNVLNGGSMYQDVNNHESANHSITDEKGREIIVCSVHHQLMIPSANSRLVAWTKLSTRRSSDTEDYIRREEEVDPEVLFIPDDNALCFQAHPEFGPKSCTDYFFKLVREYIV